MPDLAFLQPAWHWLDRHETLVGLLAIASFIVLGFQLITIPLIIAALPADYFASKKPGTPKWLRDRPAVHLAARVLANLLGASFIALGLIMLITPGQGLLCIFVGLLLTDFPAKHRLQRRLAARPAILKSMNWIRRRLHRPPLEKP